MKIEIGRFVFETFSEGDWMAFSGCEKLPDGREPLIAYNGEDVLIIDGGCGSGSRDGKYACTILKYTNDGEDVENVTAYFNSFDILCDFVKYFRRS